MILAPVASVPNAVHVLYELLKERPPEAAISHKRMPTFEEHAAFVRSKPYLAWYLIGLPDHPHLAGYQEHTIVGSIYLTPAREVGIFIFRAYHGMGYGKEAIRLLREAHPGRILANVAPGNAASHKFFQGLGAVKIQETYELA